MKKLQNRDSKVPMMENKVAIVTGANSGIGKATVHRLAREGTRIVLADLVDAADEAKAIVAEGGEALAVKVDVRDEAQVKGLFDHTLSNFGGVDILVNCAGVCHRMLVASAPLEEWNLMFDVNLKGTFLCCRAAIPIMQRGGSGAIVNIGSELGLVGLQAFAVYGATKAGVIHFTRALAVECATDGIRVNCVCPGPTDTPMLRTGVAPTPDPEARLREIIEPIPMKRIGKPEEIANAICFLLSTEASYMTGSIVVVDGGISVL